MLGFYKFAVASCTLFLVLQVVSSQLWRRPAYPPPQSYTSSINCDYERPLNGRDPPGRKCPPSCRDSSDCRSYPDHECVCDGKCGRSCVDPNHRCYPVPQSIQNGRVSITPYNKFSAIAEYKCNDGYTLNGVMSRVCQGDTTWAGEPPICELNHDMLNAKEYCDAGPVVHNARHDGQKGRNKFEKGTQLRYKCNPGYLPQAKSITTAWCVTGSFWVGPNITCVSKASGCKKPPNIHNGYARLTSGTKPGAVAEYRCISGFFLAGQVTRKCQEDGSWSGREPSCKKVVCGPPPELEHAEHDAPSGQISFAGGTQLMYSCKFGYYREGTERAICNGKRGQWDGPNMSCRARDCGAPGEIENGWRDLGYRFTYPSKVNYHCNEGYYPIGKPSRMCQANGEWKGDLPKCLPVKCNTLSPPMHGTMVGYSIEYRSIVKFTCNSGYMLIGSAERVCQADRSWSGQDVSCEEINCGRPKPLYNGYLDGHRTSVGGIYFFRCNVRTKFVGASPTTLCKENGEWTHETPQCLGQCKVPEIQNGSAKNVPSNFWLDHDQVIVPECTDGRVLNDTRTVRCNNGSWTVVPKCVPAPCATVPPLLEKGHRIFFDTVHGSRARYFCMTGYKLANPQTMKYKTCDHGKWHGLDAVCVEDLCPLPIKPKHGTIYKVGSRGKFKFYDYMTEIRHGDRLVYECERNYKLVGPRGAACTGGEWTPSKPPRCKRARHPKFSKLWRAHEEHGSRRSY